MIWMINESDEVFQVTKVNERSGDVLEKDDSAGIKKKIGMRCDEFRAMKPSHNRLRI